MRGLAGAVAGQVDGADIQDAGRLTRLPALVSTSTPMALEVFVLEMAP